jgi:TonB family protein
VASVGAAPSGSNEPSTFRLVIRAEIIPEESPQTTTPPHSNRRALALIVGGLAVLLALIWFGISVFRSDSPSTRPVSANASANPSVNKSATARNAELQLPALVSAPSEAAPVVSAELPLRPATSTAQTASAAAASAEPSSTEAKSVELNARTEPDALPSPIHEVIPDAPRSALQTIRGTIRVSVRVTLDKQGAVVAATSDDPGPSRYFERLAIEASKKWTFAPADTKEQRRMLLRFNFTRAGTTAHADRLR